MVAAEGKYPHHSALARKEQLFKEAIQLLDLGKSWEVGIRLCKELATHYEMEAFDYHKLGAILVSGLQVVFHCVGCLSNASDPMLRLVMNCTF